MREQLRHIGEMGAALAGEECQARSLDFGGCDRL